MTSAGTPAGCSASAGVAFGAFADLPFAGSVFGLFAGASVSMGSGSGSGSIAAAPRLARAGALAGGDFAGGDFAAFAGGAFAAFAAFAGDFDFVFASGSAGDSGAGSGALPPPRASLRRATSTAFSPSCSSPSFLSSALSLGTVSFSGSTAFEAAGFFLGGIAHHGSI